MQIIEIDEEIYDHILQNACVIGESASSILRRLLSLKSQTSNLPNHSSAMSSIKPTSGGLIAFLGDSRLLAEREAVGRFLLLLSWLYKQNVADFKNVLKIRGRQRLYFAESANTLDEKGNSVFPQRIPNSPYWVVTNNDTAKKERMLIDVMRVLGYSRFDQVQAGNALLVN